MSGSDPSLTLNPLFLTVFIDFETGSDPEKLVISLHLVVEDHWIPTPTNWFTRFLVKILLHLVVDSSWRVGFNIFPTILGQKRKIENFEIFRNFSKSQKTRSMKKSLKMRFSRKFFRESRFQPISDHLSQ